MQNIVVLKNLQDNIIEFDCINKHFLGYSACKQSPVRETPPIDSGRLKMTERVHLDAISSRLDLDLEKFIVQNIVALGHY